MNLSSPRSSARRIASANPRLEWPTMPKTVSTPWATRVSTSTSDTDRRLGFCAGRLTKTPSSRSATSYAATASVKPSGGFPVSGS